MPGSHYSDFSARNRQFLAEKSAWFTLQWFLGDFLARNHREIVVISRSTERHMTSHVTDLDICELLIMDADEEDSIAITVLIG